MCHTCPLMRGEFPPLRQNSHDKTLSHIEEHWRVLSRLTLLFRLFAVQRVILDSDLAKIYGATTNRLNQQVNRNRERFPLDFLFRLTKKEFDSLMSQNATSKTGRGGRRKLP